MAEEIRATWPEPYVAAISLCYDGSRPEHLDVALPLLEKSGIFATFGAYPPNLALSLKEWASVDRSHEFGNHFLYGSVDSEGLVPEWSSDTYLAEHDEAASLLREIGREPKILMMPSVRTASNAGTFPVVSEVVTGSIVKINSEVVGPFCPAYEAVRGPIPGVNRLPIERRHPLLSVVADDLDFESLCIISQIAISERSWLILNWSAFWTSQFPEKVHRQYLSWISKMKQQVLIAPVGEVLAAAGYSEVRLH